MPDPYVRVIGALRGAGWKVRERTADTAPGVADLLPPALRQRYPNVPTELVAFCGRLEECVNADETAWFLTPADYAGTSGSAFEWNAWEKLELETFEGDAENTTAVREFWNSYLPFFSDVRGDYAYFAIRVTDPPPTKRGLLERILRQSKEPERGAIVYAIEEFREVSQVAASFTEFLDQLVITLRDPDRTDSPLSGLV